MSGITRGIKSLLASKPSALSDCPKHGAPECLSCMCSIDINGKVTKDGSKIDLRYKVDEPQEVAIDPKFGEQARFDPLRDPHMRSRLNAESAYTNQEKAPASFKTPSRRWFSYCSSCNVTFLVGLAGNMAADDHPSHVATNMGARSICAYVDATSWEDSQKTLGGNSSVFFGPGSKYNALSDNVYDLKHHLSIQFAALRRALRLALTILDHRHALVEKHGLSNSYKFLWEYCTQFRFVVFSRMEAVNHWLNLDRAATGQGQLDPWVETEVLKIDEDVANLAAQGIEVKIFTLPAFEKYEPEYEFFYDRFI